MSEIVIRAPGREAPGYLRRMRRAMELQERQRTEGPSAGLLDELIDFVLAEATVAAPAGVDVREALLVDGMKQLGLDEKRLAELAALMRVLSGQYDQAARAAASM